MRRLLALLLVAPGLVFADETPWAGQVDGGTGRRGGQVRRPFDPDTEVRVTREELAERGVTNLAEALDLIPEVSVRAAGRGGLQADLRGARRGSVLVLVDGVPVSDPFYGSFDLSIVPVTDIVEIRVSLEPASPIDGPGGPGGLVEVTTLAARGPKRLAARAQASTQPGADAAVTGRADLFAGVAVRASAGGALGGRELDVAMPDGTQATIDEGAQRGYAGLRIERASGTGVVRVDLWAQHRAYVVPPGGEAGADVLVIDGEDTARLALSGEAEVAGFWLKGRAYGDLFARESISYADAARRELTAREDLAANRAGVSAKAGRPLTQGIDLLFAASFDTEEATAVGMNGMVQGGRASTGEVATGVALRSRFVRLDAGAGVAIPVSDGAMPWPEAKVAVTVAPSPILSVKLVGARKGRIPTLRERFQWNIGNPALDPELGTFGGADVTIRPSALVTISAGGYVRLVEGMVKLDPVEHEMLINLGDVTVRGLDARVDVAPRGAIGGGAAWSFTDASSSDSDDPLDFLPAHRVDAWITGRIARGGATLRARWVDEQLDNGTTLPARATLDASIHARIPGDLRVALRADNLLDERYLIRANGARAAGRVLLLSVEGVWQ